VDLITATTFPPGAEIQGAPADGGGDAAIRRADVEARLANAVQPSHAHRRAVWGEPKEPDARCSTALRRSGLQHGPQPSASRFERDKILDLDLAGANTATLGFGLLRDDELFGPGDAS
jgi:hypothetical protein